MSNKRCLTVFIYLLTAHISSPFDCLAIRVWVVRNYIFKCVVVISLLMRTSIVFKFFRCDDMRCLMFV